MASNVFIMTLEPFFGVDNRDIDSVSALYYRLYMCMPDDLRSLNIRIGCFVYRVILENWSNITEIGPLYR